MTEDKFTLRAAAIVSAVTELGTMCLQAVSKDPDLIILTKVRKTYVMEIHNLLKALGTLESEERAAVGKLINGVVVRLENKFKQIEDSFELKNAIPVPKKREDEGCCDGEVVDDNVIACRLIRTGGGDIDFIISELDPTSDGSERSLEISFSSGFVKSKMKSIITSKQLRIIGKTFLNAADKIDADNNVMKAFH